MEVNRLISKSLQEMPASRRQRALAKGDLSKLIHMGLNENNYGGEFYAHTETFYPLLRSV